MEWTFHTSFLLRQGFVYCSLGMIALRRYQFIAIFTELIESTREVELNNSYMVSLKQVTLIAKLRGWLGGEGTLIS